MRGEGGFIYIYIYMLTAVTFLFGAPSLCEGPRGLVQGVFHSTDKRSGLGRLSRHSLTPSSDSCGLSRNND